MKRDTCGTGHLQSKTQNPKSKMEYNMLIVQHLRKEFASADAPLVVLRDVSFELRPGESVSIVGHSGSGKSTLLHILGSLDRPTSGTVRLGDLDVTALDAAGLADYRANKVGFVFQDHHLLPQLTALENVLLPMLAAGTVPSCRSTRRMDPASAEELLARVGLAERMHALPAKLSGGERQRVAIARALVNGPKLLLADEPTGNLDQDSAEPVAKLFLELARENKTMLVVVTHNMDLARRFDRILQLQGGLLRKE
jgi:lipoprotein-releasing system ATP-binding protein